MSLNLAIKDDITIQSIDHNVLALATCYLVSPQEFAWGHNIWTHSAPSTCQILIQSLQSSPIFTYKSSWLWRDSSQAHPKYLLGKVFITSILKSYSVILSIGPYLLFWILCPFDFKINSSWSFLIDYNLLLSNSLLRFKKNEAMCISSLLKSLSHSIKCAIY